MVGSGLEESGRANLISGRKWVGGKWLYVIDRAWCAVLYGL